MNQKRKAGRFAVYRRTQNGMVFMSNHRTEGGAKHVAACFQACAPVHLSYVVDPPHGALASVESEAGLGTLIKRIFSRA